MTRGQTSIPTRWLVADARLGDDLWLAVEQLPRGSGVLFLFNQLTRAERARIERRLRQAARRRGLIVADEGKGQAARVHDATEIRQAALRRVPLLFLSPIYPTRSHPEWKPLTRMRAAALLRLAKAPVIALGGMDESRFQRVAPLGFHGWAGIDAWGGARAKFAKVAR